MNKTSAIPRKESSLQLDAILDRFESLGTIVRDELENYQSSTESNRSFPNHTLTVVIPVYNEQATIARVISRIATLPYKLEIIVVDDGSTDSTPEILGRLKGVPGVKLIFKAVNEGKGAAIRDGFAVATGDLIMIQDADLEYDPRDIPDIVRPILEDRCDVVFGSRYLHETQQDSSMIHRAGNWLLTEFSNLFSGIRLTDMETCYKVFRREVLKDLNIKQNRFGVEPEMTAKIARRGYRIEEVPISYHARGYKQGKKISLKDLPKAFYCIVRYGICD